MPFGEENIISLPLFFCHAKCYTRHNESPQFCPVFHAFGSPAKPRLKGNMYMENEYIIEMLNITKEFPGIKANDNITLQLKKGEIHALLGENGAGKSTLMSILFGLYQPTSGIIKKNGQEVHINTPNDANDLNIGMVHQHFKLVECFSVLDNIILGVEPTKGLFLEKKNARAKVMELSEKYGLMVDPDALISDITVGMQQRTEILKMLYRDNEVLIFDEPTAVLTPQEIDELMKIMKNLAKEGKSILFITHKLNEIMEVADRCTILRKGKYIGTVNISETSKEELSRMMVGRPVLYDRLEKTGEAGAEPEYLIVSSGFTKTVTGAPGATITLDAANSNTPIDVTTTGTIETIASHATVTAQAALNTADVTLKLRLYIATSGSNTFNYTGTEYDYTPNLTGTVNANTLLTLNRTNVGQAVTEGDRLLFVLVADDSQSPATSTPISLAVSASVGIE